MNAEQRKLDQEVDDLEARIEKLHHKKKSITAEIKSMKARVQQIHEMRGISILDMDKVRSAAGLDMLREIKEEAVYRFRVRKTSEDVPISQTAPQTPNKTPTSHRTAVRKIAPGCPGFEHPDFLNGKE